MHPYPPYTQAPRPSGIPSGNSAHIQQQQQQPSQQLYPAYPQQPQQHDQGWYTGAGQPGPAAYIGDEAGIQQGYPVHVMSTDSQAWAAVAAGPSDIEDDFLHEPPLLEELGINFQHIWSKTKTIILPVKPLEDSIMDDADLAGPLFFLLAFGVFLLLTGKVHFGYIYGFGVSGCTAMYLVLNLLSSNEIDIWRVCSILGYGLLPVIVLAFLGMLFRLNSSIGKLLAVFVILWSTYASSRLFEKALVMTHQRWLVAYPVGLLYSVFVLITVF